MLFASAVTGWRWENSGSEKNSCKEFASFNVLVIDCIINFVFVKFSNFASFFKILFRKLGLLFHPDVQTCIYIYIFFFFFALRPNAGHGLLILEVSRSDTTTHHSRWESSGRVISSSQRPLPDNTQHSQQTNIHGPRWESNPRSQ